MEKEVVPHTKFVVVTVGFVYPLISIIIEDGLVGIKTGASMVEVLMIRVAGAPSVYGATVL